jgi:PAS domain S-box-containing protein
MASTTRAADIEKEEIIQEKLLDLHQKIIELEKLEIFRQSAGVKTIKIEDVYNDFFEETKTCMLIIQDRRIVFLSAPLARLLGYAREEMIQTTFASYVHPDELPRLADYYLRRISGREAPPLYECVVRGRDGRNIRVEIRAGTIPYQGKLADFAIVEELDGRGEPKTGPTKSG